MRSKLAVVVLFVMVVTSSWWLVSRGRAADAQPPAAQAAGREVELTVYAQDFGLVRELRPMRLAAGSNRLRVLDVSKEMDPHSVLLRWQGDAPNRPQMVAHSYDLGVASSAGLLKHYLGKEVEIVRYGENGREADRQRGTLMVEADGEVVVQTDGKFFVQPAGTIVAPANGEIITIPQLSVQAESLSEQDLDLEVAYLTRGLSWSADYVATLSPGSSALALECWATVTNRTGTDYPNAKVSLIAGTPNRAVNGAAVPRRPATYAFQPQRNNLYVASKRSEDQWMAGGPPEAVGNFHAYPIKKPTTVVQEQMNRLLMLASARVPVTRDYSARPPTLSPWDDTYWGTPHRPERGHVQVALTFFNRQKSGLGVPLPQGAIRVYEPDRSGSLRYAGAAAIENTPKEQTVQFTLARAFDLFTEWRIVKKQRINKRTVRKQVEWSLHNEKAAPVELRVVQGFGGRWKVVRASHPHSNLDADHAQWRVKLPAGQKTTVSYTVDLSG